MGLLEPLRPIGNVPYNVFLAYWVAVAHICTLLFLYNTPHYYTDLDIAWSCCGSYFFNIKTCF